MSRAEVLTPTALCRGKGLIGTRSARGSDEPSSHYRGLSISLLSCLIIPPAVLGREGLEHGEGGTGRDGR